MIIQPGAEKIWMDPKFAHIQLQYGQPISPVFMIMEDNVTPPKKHSQQELF
jgi:hypothetical protein